MHVCSRDGAQPDFFTLREPLAWEVVPPYRMLDLMTCHMPALTEPLLLGGSRLDQADN